MGEARRRGTHEQRQQLAIDKRNQLERAIAERTHADGLAWLAYQCATSVKAPDERQTEGAAVIWEPDESTWRLVHYIDVPEWVKEQGVVKEMMEGTQVCRYPDLGGLWWRVVKCEPPDEAEAEEASIDG